jgi:phytase-like protein
VPGWTVERLDWEDEALGEIALPRGPMQLRSGFGSGLATRRGDTPGLVWAVGDRGPNLKAKTAVKRYGLDRLKALEADDGAKVMPRPDLGPAIAELRVAGNRVELLRTLRIRDAHGRPVSGLPVPEGGHARCEPALDLDGNRLAPDPSGLDSEGIAALADGGFWIGDEFGPSLVRLDAAGKVLKRLVPEGVGLEGAAYPVEPCLPAIAARRQLNRGFEALALSADGKWLFLAFQSPLAHPDEAAHEQGRHVRLWRLDAGTAEVTAQYLYPLDPPGTFSRDREKGPFDLSDVKVSELCAVGGDSLLVLERGSETTKIYRITPTDDCALPPEHLDIATSPTVEELSRHAEGPGLPALAKQLLFSSDEAPAVAADLEGMAILSPHELLLVNDNDFGVEGVTTSFWKVTFERPTLC